MDHFGVSARVEGNRSGPGKPRAANAHEGAFNQGAAMGAGVSGVFGEVGKMKREEKIFWLMALCAAAAVFAAMAQSWRLEWDYPPAQRTNIVFEIWRATNATGPFLPWVTVAQTNAPITTDEPMGFFIARASNTVTHKVSDWSSR